MKFIGVMVTVFIMAAWVGLDRKIELFRLHWELTALGLGLTILASAVVFARIKRKSAAIQVGGAETYSEDRVGGGCRFCL